MIVDNGKYYVYRHTRLDKNEPFYIGISKKYNKKPYHRAFWRHGRNSIWKNIVNKTDYEVEILLETDDIEFLYQKEIEFIKLYGRINMENGSLSNLTDGGEGCRDTSGEVSKKISERLTGIKRSKETIDKIKEKRKFQICEPATEERKRKISEANGGQNNGMYGKVGRKNVNSKPVTAYNTDGSFYKTWESCRLACKDLSGDYRYISYYIKCQKPYLGFIWKFFNV